MSQFNARRSVCLLGHTELSITCSVHITIQSLTPSPGPVSPPPVKSFRTQTPRFVSPILWENFFGACMNRTLLCPSATHTEYVAQESIRPHLTSPHLLPFLQCRHHHHPPPSAPSSSSAAAASWAPTSWTSCSGSRLKKTKTEAASRARKLPLGSPASSRRPHGPMPRP